MLELVYKTEKKIGNGTADNPFRIVYQFWKREADQIILICECDRPYGTIIKKRHPKQPRFEIGDKVEIIGESQPEVYQIKDIQGEKAVLTWFGDLYTIESLKNLKIIK